MACATVTLHVSVVYIIRLVTAVAARTYPDKLEITVATFAGNRGVTPKQGKMCKVVIKADLAGPACSAMTLLALRTKGFFMHIAQLMTAYARLITNRRMHVALMALITTGIAVAAGQWKGCFIMIESALAPTHFVVALIALFAIATEMRIVVSMTPHTCGRLFTGYRMRPMTGHALQ